MGSLPFLLFLLLVRELYSTKRPLRFSPGTLGTWGKLGNFGKIGNSLGKTMTKPYCSLTCLTVAMGSHPSLPFLPFSSTISSPRRESRLT